MKVAGKQLIWISATEQEPISSSPVVLKNYRIQEIRLIQALIEANWEVGLPSALANSFLNSDAGFQSMPAPSTPRMVDLEISTDHSKPLTRIGCIEKVLVFPESFFERVRRRWSNQRRVRMVFAGFFTVNRGMLMREIVESMACSAERSFSTICVRLLFRLFWLSGRCSIGLVNLLLRSALPLDSIEFTDRGRDTLFKLQDDIYLEKLLSGKFALCPDGDFVWTYRFFEATACGCTPVIQSYCDHYEGYAFIHNRDKLRLLDKRQLDSNYDRSIQHLTCRNELLSLHP